VPTKVSTIEAVAYALVCLGEEESAVASFYQGLQLSVDTLLVQGGKQAVYGHAIGLDADIQGSDKERIAGVTPAMRRPEICPYCDTTGYKNFKNVGKPREYDTLPLVRAARALAESSKSTEDPAAPIKLVVPRRSGGAGIATNSTRVVSDKERTDLIDANARQWLCRTCFQKFSQ
jgi:hypothetical protein